jgi:hypothetical protein
MTSNTQHGVNSTSQHLKIITTNIAIEILDKVTLSISKSNLSQVDKSFILLSAPSTLNLRVLVGGALPFDIDSGTKVIHISSTYNNTFNNICTWLAI